MATDSGMHQEMKQFMRGAPRGLRETTPSKLEMLLGAPKVLANAATGAAAIAGKSFMKQPLEVDGKGLELLRDPDHKLLGVEHHGVVPASRISEAGPGLLRKLFNKLQ